MVISVVLYIKWNRKSRKHNIITKYIFVHLKSLFLYMKIIYSTNDFGVLLLFLYSRYLRETTVCVHHCGKERAGWCSWPSRPSQWMWFSHRNIQKLGRPEPSEDSDLATALHRLSLRRQNYLSEKQFFAEEWERKIQVLANQKEGVSGCGTPTESLASLCTDQSETTDFSSTSCLRCFMPEKLQIVKPLEGNKSEKAILSHVPYWPGLVLGWGLLLSW